MNIAVMDLGYGDAGKGTVCSLLSSESESLTIRYNGGPQADHYSPSKLRSVHLTPSGLGDMYWSEFVYVYFPSWLDEITLDQEKDIYYTTYSHKLTPIITPLNINVHRDNELLRIRNNNAHGSCGWGIYEAFKCKSLGIAPLMCDSESDMRKKLLEQEILYGRKFRDIGYWIWHTSNSRAKVKMDLPDFHKYDTTIFEGAQGYRIGMTTGTMPYCSPSDTSFKNVDYIVQDLKLKTPLKVGISRSFWVRHGAGPLDNEYPIYSPEYKYLRKQDNTLTDEGLPGSVRYGQLELDRLLEIYQEAGCDSYFMNHADLNVTILAKGVPVNISNIKQNDLVSVLESNGFSVFGLGYGPNNKVILDNSIVPLNLVGLK